MKKSFKNGALIIIAAISGLGLAPIPQQTRGADVLAIGFPINGRVTFERSQTGGVDAVIFFIKSENTLGSARILMKYVSDPTTVSAAIYKRLLPSTRITMRITGLAPLPPGTDLDASLTENVAMCHAEPRQRDGRSAVYMLRCMNADQARRITRDGALVFELDMQVDTQNGSALDKWITTRMTSEGESQFIFVRFET